MRLELRKIQKDDCIFLNQLRNSCVNFLHDSRTFTLDQTYQWFESLTIPYYIIFKDGNRAGYIRLSEYKNNSIYIGCDVSPDYRRQGIAYEAISFILPVIFKEYSLEKVYADVLSYNTPSLELYLKLGFKIESVREKSVLKNGILVDSILLSKYA